MKWFRRRKPASPDADLVAVQDRVHAVEDFLAGARGDITDAQKKLEQARTMLDAHASLYRPKP